MTKYHQFYVDDARGDSFFFGTRNAEMERLRNIDFRIGRLAQSIHLSKILDRPKEIFFCTTNIGKVAEFKALLGVLNAQAKNAINEIGVDFKTLPGRFPDPLENRESLRENAAKKALHYSRLMPDKVVVSEDSGLVIQSLNGEPGVYSARYAKMELGIPETMDLIEGLQGKHELHRDAHMKAVELYDKRQEQSLRDFVNNVVLIERVLLARKLDAHFNCPEAVASNGITHYATAAEFQTVAVAAKNGELLSVQTGHMQGAVVIPAKPDYSDPQFLHHLASDFGYNPLFAPALRYSESSDLVLLSSVPKEERLKWNHRSSALTLAVLEASYKAFTSEAEERVTA